MAMKPIGLSFKNTEEDKKLYDWIASHSNMSGFIKDILRREMKGEAKEVFNIKAESITQSNSLIELDF